MAVHFPEDLISLFAVTTRDVIWFKRRLLRFFEKEGVPESILIEVERQKGEPTIKLCQFVVDELEAKGADGIKIIQGLMSGVANWKDFSRFDRDEKDSAKARQAEFKRAIREYADQQRYKLEKEKKSQGERVERVKISPLDHAKLESFRERFDKIFIMKNRHARGDEFQVLMNDIFSYYCQKSLGAFSRKGEQIDGQFYSDDHYYFVEVRWQEEKAKASDVSILRDRAEAAFVTDVRGLFISFNGFTPDCLENLEKRSSERVILMDGLDLRTVLNADIAFDVLLDEKLARAVRDGRPFVSARDIITEQVEQSKK